MLFVVITGLSGAGKSLASHQFEDLGFFCIDNLPPELIPTFAELCQRSKGEIDRVALVIDVRGGKFFARLFESLDCLQDMGVTYRILFLDAEDEVILNRFKETRRRHPLADDYEDLLECIQQERQELSEIRERADKIIDTTSATPRVLRDEIVHSFLESEDLNHMIVKIISFGFKYGIPHDADLVLDVRFLVNPHYVKELGHLNGTDRKVVEFVMDDNDTQEYLKRLFELLDFTIPRYVEEGKVYLTVAVGCTGGRHRSVVIANELGVHLQTDDLHCVIQHRDISKKKEIAAELMGDSSTSSEMSALEYTQPRLFLPKPREPREVV
ncbi:MAG: RNase adapter RapZ [Armatimonadetes bacterium]|nr:RNase adapter RapZ [Armatimonadota bacterium]PIU65597.1 MAG: RNase adapter RapZ [Armatimonadetes bacterium CG07_land_8_20_14_0_80_59_28]PIX38917.1 MAG: RNase adapter RapZ [Armatimonadetes bacterium CG_4_8_14_3_um_filter_58_9]PIY39235.1 MAG: RNase adapter RapZ [Armatimonadetes bacterium CG_4_10_14_3_um_filter_59_10]PJB62864.1 MAG: RNase adapter RapZ [Armatimonadetes bacterium CG_4_9_14_3_um_filter_58_7]